MGKAVAKGISPILATVILISATVAGGALLYQYFMKTIATYLADNNVDLRVTVAQLPNGDLLVHYAIANRGNSIIKAHEIRFEPNGTIQAINLSNATIAPGSEITGYARLPAGALQPLGNTYAILTYYIGDKRFESRPVAVTHA